MQIFLWEIGWILHHCSELCSQLAGSEADSLCLAQGAGALPAAESCQLPRSQPAGAGRMAQHRNSFASACISTFQMPDWGTQNFSSDLFWTADSGNLSKHKGNLLIELIWWSRGDIRFPRTREKHGFFCMHLSPVDFACPHVFYIDFSFLKISQPPHYKLTAKRTQELLLVFRSKYRPICISVSLQASWLYFRRKSCCSLQSDSIKSFDIKPDLRELWATQVSNPVDLLE